MDKRTAIAAIIMMILIFTMTLAAYFYVRSKYNI